MRVLIVSDTHRQSHNFYRALERVSPVDMIIHCGDAEGYEDELAGMAGCPLRIVQGNNDFFSPLPKDLEFRYAGLNFWVNHGHRYYVNADTDIIKKAAADRGADIICFGHTHRPLIEEDTDLSVVALNPGSLTYPRQEGRRPSYIVMEIDQNGVPHYEIQYL